MIEAVLSNLVTFTPSLVTGLEVFQWLMNQS
jgi:hypothetical protein